MATPAEIDVKQFLNDEWHNKYSASFALATIKLLKSEKLKVDEYLEELINFSQDPINTSDEKLSKLSKTKKFELYALGEVIALIRRIATGGKEREYFNLANTSLRFHNIFHIGDNLHNNIQIMEVLLQTNLYRDLI